MEAVGLTFEMHKRNRDCKRPNGRKNPRTPAVSRASMTILFFLVLFTAHPAFAINGFLFYGVGARNRAMGGANGAAPVDTSTIIINPAGIGRLGNTADFGAHFLFPKRFIDRTSATGPLVNTTGGLEYSDQETYVTPFSGVSWRGENSPWALGMTICGASSQGATYNHPRIDPDFLLEPDLTTPISATGDVYDTSSFLNVIKIVPGVSYDITDRLSVGASMHVNVALFSADWAVPTPGGLVQTAGNGRTNVSYLMGLQVGVLYDINERWSVGAAYTSPQWQLDDFDHYEDIIPDFELPPEVRLGLAFKATKNLRLTVDYKYIGWEQIDLFERLPSEGGFGWRDQHTVGLGAEAWLTNSVVGRIGWNYGRSPIQPDVLFANALVPAIHESHLGGGIEFKIGEHHSLAFSAIGTFHTEKVDDGSGDLFSQSGAGVRVGYEGFDIDATWTVKF